VKHTVIILFIFLLSSCSIFIGESRETSVLYRWEVAEKVFVWKYIGNEEINPKYKGEVKDNQPDGMGITIFPDGYRHSGQYKKGKRHGSGTWFTKKSGKINKHSKGEWKHGYFWDMITYDFDGEVRDKYKDGLLIYGVLFTNKENDIRVWTRYDQKRDGVYVGEIKNRQPNGIGLVKYNDGNELNGTWKDGLFSDNGTFVYPNGSKYIGGYKGGKFHGQGILTFSNGEKNEGIFKEGFIWDGFGAEGLSDGSKYVGEYKDGKFHGQGTTTSFDGSKYTGEYKNGQMDGQGTFTSSDGSKYIGEYKNGQMDGQGTFTSSDGSKYIGEYKNGQMDGQGTFISSDGSKYIGMFKNDFRNGQGIETSPDMKIIKGVWKNGIFWNGFGREKRSDGKKARDFYEGGKIIKKELTLSNGDKYFGEFKDGKYDGQGTFTWPSGGKYTGKFKDGKYNGQGTYTYGKGEWEGQKYVGEFKNGKFNGQGIYTWSDGRRFVGEFYLGTFWNGTEYDINGKNTIKVENGKIIIIKK